MCRLKLINNSLVISTEKSELDILLDNITDSNCHHELLVMIRLKVMKYGDLYTLTKL